jgi:hypothetical protein
VEVLLGCLPLWCKVRPHKGEGTGAVCVGKHARLEVAAGRAAALIPSGARIERGSGLAVTDHLAWCLRCLRYLHGA